MVFSLSDLLGFVFMDVIFVSLISIYSFRGKEREQTGSAEQSKEINKIFKDKDWEKMRVKHAI